MRTINLTEILSEEILRKLLNYCIDKISNNQSLDSVILKIEKHQTDNGTRAMLRINVNGYCIFDSDCVLHSNKSADDYIKELITDIIFMYFEQGIKYSLEKTKENLKLDKNAQESIPNI